MGLESAFVRSDGTPNEPGVHSPWESWIAASSTYNYCCDDPLIDWLELYGAANGLAPDEGGYDVRTDLRAFLASRAIEFEAAVTAWLSDRHQLVRIPTGSGASRSKDNVLATWAAMSSGAEIIAQGVLWNPDARIYGVTDLLVRSDVLRRLFPNDLTDEDASSPAPDLSLNRAHYRVVDIKFTTLDLLKNGHAGGSNFKYAIQVWLYNEALGRLQGFIPPGAFLLGRKWKSSSERGSSAFQRLARVDRDRDLNIGTYAEAACKWLRQVRSAGKGWNVSPTPSVPELWPNLRTDDQRWRPVKLKIAHELEDLALLPRVTVDKRAAAIGAGLSRWRDPSCSADRLGVTGAKYQALLDAVIRANQSEEDGPIVFPDRVSANQDLWREPLAAEFYVDFETVNDLDDDFSRFPETNGQPLIFMIGCGHLEGPPDAQQWVFRVFTAAALSLSEENRVISEWMAYIRDVSERLGSTLEDARLFHWSPAETSTLLDAYNAAYVRQNRPVWPTLKWIDLLNRVIKEEPVSVRGAFGFGLKAIAKAMHKHGLIETSWTDGPTDGLGAMVGAWHCDREARRRSRRMPELDLMKEIEAYNEVDCRVMAEVLQYLREHR